MPKYSQRRIKLVFTLALVNIGFAILCTILAHKYDFIWLRNYNALNIFAYIGAVYLAKNKDLNAARILYLITSSFGIAIISSFVGKNGSIEFIYMFNIGLPFILFLLGEKEFLLFYLLYYLLFYGHCFF